MTAVRLNKALYDVLKKAAPTIDEQSIMEASTEPDDIAEVREVLASVRRQTNATWALVLVMLAGTVGLGWKLSDIDAKLSELSSTLDIIKSVLGF